MSTQSVTQPLEPTLESACRRWPDRPAITFRDITLSYGELWDKVTRLARAYVELGVRPGDRIVCQLRNCPEHVIAINAAWACGAIHVGTDNDLTGPELSWLAQHTQARVLVFQAPTRSDDRLAPVRAVQSAQPAITVVIHEASDTDLGAQRLDDLMAEPVERGQFHANHRDRDQTGLLLLTSGTTGRPKAVMETLPACWAKMQFFADAFGPEADDVHLMYLPMAHVFGLRLSLLALLSGGRLVLLDQFSPNEALRLVTEERVTVLPGMPAHLTLLLGALDPARHNVRTLRWAITAASKLPTNLAEQIYTKFGTEILYVYGCSENFTIQTTDRDEILAGSVGSLVFEGPEGEPPDGTARVVNPDDHSALTTGAVGEIAFGARRPVHYWGAPDAATDGWYYTGDLGRIDPDGRVYVLGRLKELINRGGLKVAPSEIEAALIRHPQVADAAVVGTPDPVLGEAICACVVAADGHPGLAQLREFLGHSLARHKLPDELIFVNEIPRTKIGKVDRSSLVASIVAAGGPAERLRAR